MPPAGFLLATGRGQAILAPRPADARPLYRKGILNEYRRPKLACDIVRRRFFDAMARRARRVALKPAGRAAAPGSLAAQERADVPADVLFE